MAGNAYNGLLALEELPLEDLGLSQVDEGIIDLVAGGDDDNIGNTLWSRSRLETGKPSRHLGLARLVQGHNIEVQVIAMGLFDDANGCLDLGEVEGVKRVGELNGAHFNLMI